MPAYRLVSAYTKPFVSTITVITCAEPLVYFVRDARSLTLHDDEGELMVQIPSHRLLAMTAVEEGACWCC